ncbi:hypothetical protein B0H63DRAFT_101895 [Podospora didyma]|uniref:Uncharacterized protein n=1 Tax=Podospora didyma TaxID=330526 RepID=A0AAE0NXM9_9PEZI|nr:hypothetical protein B0H63DRAFT_101895 [Podospora didyma]
MNILVWSEQRSQRRLILEVHTTTTTIPEPERGLQSIHKMVSAQSHGDEGSTSQLDQPETPVVLPFPLGETETQQELINPVSSNPPSRGTSSTSSNELPLVKTSVKLQCSLDCRCQCHSHRVEYRSPSWLKPALGWFFLNYQSLPLFGSVVCDLPSCRNSRPPTSMSFGYYFPAWVWNRVIYVSASLSTISGAGTVLHMMVPRIIPANGNIWFHIEYGDMTKAAIDIERKGILPCDRLDNGTTVLSYAIQFEASGLSTSLLQAWPRKGMEMHYWPESGFCSWEKLAQTHKQPSGNSSYGIVGSTVIRSLAYITQLTPWRMATSPCAIKRYKRHASWGITKRPRLSLWLARKSIVLTLREGPR